MSSNTVDALLSLRSAIQSNQPISYQSNSGPSPSLSSATHLVLSPDLSLPKSIPTRLRKPGGSATVPDANSQDFFTLEAVYLAWKLRDASGAEYMKQAREEGLAVGFVSVTERKHVVDWLEGRTNNLQNIVPLVSESTTPPGTPPAGAARLLATSPSFKTSDNTSSPSKRKYIADAADAEVVKKIRLNEIELGDRNTVLRGVKPNNFTSVRTAFVDRLKKAKEAGRGGNAPTASTTPDPKLLAKKAKNLYPIIIVSSSPTALITMHNVKKFLQYSSYQTSSEARQEAAVEGNTRPEDMIPIYRKRTLIDSGGREIETQVRYAVVDSTEALAKFGPDCWERVVCVMTTGQAWQFKPYKWSDPKVLFHHVKGIYLSLSSDPPNTKIKDWNVTELKIDTHRRHVDKSVVAQFWKILDAWTMANKPWLMKT